MALGRVGVPWHRLGMIKRRQSSDSVIDLLDRVLDKGIVIDASIRVAVAGIDLLSVESRVVVASIATYVSSATGLPESACEAGGQRIQELPDHRHSSVARNKLESHRIDDSAAALDREERVVRHRTLVDESPQGRP